MRGGGFMDEDCMSQSDYGSRTSSMNGAMMLAGGDRRDLRIPYESSDSDNEDSFHDAFDDSYKQIQVLKTEQKMSTSKLFNIIGISEERMTLPHMRPPNQKISAIQLLKDVIGKDLTKISFPVYLNEPLSIVQKAAEPNEQAYLLEKAAKEPNSLKRIALIAAFNGTRLQHIKDRQKKPFNSLLGETYELVTKEFRFISEQVGHHPPTTAFYMESPYFEQYSCQANTAKFNGRYIIIAPKICNYINLKLPDGTVENYYWTVA